MGRSSYPATVYSFYLHPWYSIFFQYLRTSKEELTKAVSVSDRKRLQVQSEADQGHQPLIRTPQSRSKSFVEIVLVIALCSFLFSAVSPVDDDVQQEALGTQHRILCVNVSQTPAPTPNVRDIQFALLSAIRNPAVSTQFYFKDDKAAQLITSETIVQPHINRAPPSTLLSTL